MPSNIVIQWKDGTAIVTATERDKAVQVEVDRFDRLMQRITGNEPLIPQERRLLQSFLTAHLSGKIDEVG